MKGAGPTTDAFGKLITNFRAEDCPDPALNRRRHQNFKWNHPGNRDCG